MTVLSSAVALLLAVPVAIGVALFLTQYAPARLAQPVGCVVDLLAAVPSIIYGLWGIKVLGRHRRAGRGAHLPGRHPRLDPAAAEDRRRAGTVFLAAIVLAIMILPIVTAHQPRGVRADAVDAQGGCARARRHAVGDDPHRRPAVRQARRHLRVDAGAGPRARRDDRRDDHPQPAGPAETFDLSLFFGGETFARIANNASEFATPNKTGAFIAAGLVLFVLTFVVNAVARIVIARSARED